MLHAKATQVYQNELTGTYHKQQQLSRTTHFRVAAQQQGMFQADGP